MQRVVISGPESTGKSTLARRLADHYATSVCPEYVRVYLEAQPRQPTSLVRWEEVDAIARGQVDAEEAAARAATRVLICDTDLHSTKVYCEHYFGRCPEWIARAAAARPYLLHLLLDVDVPWIRDPMRDRPENRREMFERFRAELRGAGRRVVEVRGPWQARYETALAAVEQALNPS